MEVGQVIEGLKVKEAQAEEVWRAFRELFGEDYFLVQVERDFGPKLMKDQEKFFKELDRIKTDART